MTAEDVLTESRRLGIVLEAHGSTLRYRAPQGILTPELKDALRLHKAEVLAHLRRRPEPASPPDYAATACVCLVPIGGTGPDRCGVCALPLICPGCGWCRGCKLLLRFPPGRGPYG